VPERKTRIPNASRGRRAGDAGEQTESRDGPPRNVRGRRTRQMLVDAARTVFEREGFLHTRIADICTAAKTSHGNFYTYFPSKEEIFREVVDSVEMDLLTMAGAPPEADPVERVRIANRHYLKQYRDNAAILSVIQQVATFDPEVRELLVKRQRELAGVIERRTRALQKAGQADRNVDPAYAAQALGGMVADFADHLFNDKTAFDLESSVDQLTRLWVNALGITTKPPATRTKRSQRGHVSLTD
jgi:AcrR family transcriptional regulator